MNSLKRGAFVVFEGCDRSGKTTQIERLVNRLNTNGTPARLAKYRVSWINTRFKKQGRWMN